MRYDYIIFSNEEEKNKFKKHLDELHGGRTYTQHDLLKQKNEYNLNITDDYDADIALYYEIFSKTDIYNIIQLLRKNDNEDDYIEYKTNDVELSDRGNILNALIFFCYLYNLMNNNEYITLHRSYG